MRDWIEPARIRLDEHGTPYSEVYADVYHAAEGGPGQAQHVFLAGNDLPARWQGRDRFVILETGFGAGLNFLATATAWRADPARCPRLHYLSVEKHPLSLADLKRLHAAWPQFATTAAALHALWPLPLPGVHRLEFEHGRLVLTLIFADAAKALRRLTARVDAFYLDGFAPEHNPEMWSPELCRALARLAAPDATLATWSVAAAVRKALADNGFTLEKRPGFGRKREMLTGRHRPHPNAAPPQPTPPSRREALVIGAGLAGCTVAERLAARGWEIALLDARPAPAQAASGNPAGIFMPLVARDDNFASRLSRAAFLYARQRWNALIRNGHPIHARACGVLQIARDARHEARQRALATAYPWPEDFLRFIPAEAARAHLGGRLPAHGGWLFSQAGYANPPSLCAAHLAAAGVRLHPHFGRRVARLIPGATGWRALDETGRAIAEAAVVILALGAEATRLAPADALPIAAVRGQISLIEAHALAGIELALCREGYATPETEGICCIGASYAHDAETTPRAEDDAANLARLDRLLPGLGAAAAPALRGARVGFRAVAPDRLPLVGALPDPNAGARPPNTPLHKAPRIDGVYGLLGYASRGLVWANLMAELLASQLEGEPLPLENELVAAVDPARFAIKRILRAP